LNSPLLSEDQQEIVLKCATIAPEGFPWAEVIKKFSSEIQKKTSGAVKMEWYFSSIAGDEPEIAKKIKEGSLDCAWLTGNGLSYIIPPVRILELPFFLRNIREVDFIRKKIEKLFQILAGDYGMKFFGFSDIGFVYIFSKRTYERSERSQRKGNVGVGWRLSWRIYRKGCSRRIPSKTSPPSYSEC